MLQGKKNDEQHRRVGRGEEGVVDEQGERKRKGHEEMQSKSEHDRHLHTTA